MSFLSKLIASVVFVAAFNSLSAQAQTLKAAMSQEIASNVKFLNLESEKSFVLDSEYLDDEPMAFAFDTQSVVTKDVTGDGIDDAVVLLFYCEKTNCHPTTRSSDLVVFKGLGKNQFKRLGAAPLLGISAKVNSVNKGVINLTSYEYGDNDPSCCATKETKQNFKIIKNQLVEIGYHNRISNY